MLQSVICTNGCETGESETGGDTMSGSFIAERFRRVVTLHVVKNLLPYADGQVPQILGIHGASGSGKTYQCEYMLHELQVQPFVISGGELESPDAGAPARLIRTTYLNASKYVDEHRGRPAAILINDIDTALGEFGPLVQYTTNRQMVFVELMNRTDYPRVVEGKPTRRIPIIFTGNDFTKMYPPLIRLGRMTSFDWKPTAEETQAIVETLLPMLRPAEVKELVARFASSQIALFSQLKAMLFDDQLYAFIKQEGSGPVIQQLLSGRDLRPSWSITFKEVIAKAEELARQAKYQNHLEGS